jgi:hypothetical protein
MRAVRTADFLYIRNFEPDRWPAGDPNFESTQGAYGDVDASPTKDYMLKHKSEPNVSALFELAFGKRPAEELYDLKADPWQMNDVAGKDEYRAVKDWLAAILKKELVLTQDPRAIAKGGAFDNYKYYHGEFIEKEAEEEPQ